MSFFMLFKDSFILFLIYVLIFSLCNSKNVGLTIMSCRGGSVNIVILCSLFVYVMQMFCLVDISSNKNCGGAYVFH